MGLEVPHGSEDTSAGDTGAASWLWRGIAWLLHR
jgi:hypothetical protein